MSMIREKYVLKINFVWDDGVDESEKIELWVPANTTVYEIISIIKKEHNFLCCDDEEDLYGCVGRNYETLLDYVCEKYNWKWNKIKVDMEIELF